MSLDMWVKEYVNIQEMESELKKRKSALRDKIAVAVEADGVPEGKSLTREVGSKKVYLEERRGMGYATDEAVMYLQAKDLWDRTSMQVLDEEALEELILSEEVPPGDIEVVTIDKEKNINEWDFVKRT